MDEPRQQVSPRAKADNDNSPSEALAAERIDASGYFSVGKGAALYIKGLEVRMPGRNLHLKRARRARSGGDFHGRELFPGGAYAGGFSEDELLGQGIRPFAVDELLLE